MKKCRMKHFMLYLTNRNNKKLDNYKIQNAKRQVPNIHKKEEVSNSIYKTEILPDDQLPLVWAITDPTSQASRKVSQSWEDNALESNHEPNQDDGKFQLINSPIN